MSDLYLMVLDLPPIDERGDDAPELAGYAEIADTLRAPMGVGDEGFGGDDD